MELQSQNQNLSFRGSNGRPKQKTFKMTRAGTSGKAPTEIRILSYNIHKGFSTTKRRFVLEQIKQAIRIVNADIVFLQEVVGENREHAEEVEGWPDQSQFEYLADEVWPHFAYGKNAIGENQNHGNAILSRFPIIQCENENISTNKYEKRGLLHGTIEIPTTGERLECFCVHMDLFKRGRLQQFEKIASRIESQVPKGTPFVLAGDFNDWAENISDALFERNGCHELFETVHGGHARTFPSQFPLLCLDRIYYRSLKPQSAKVLTGKPWDRLSDHAAIFGVFHLEKESRD